MPDFENRPSDMVKDRALAGVFIVASRGAVILLVAFGGTVLLAHLLTPHDFGVVAVGSAVVTVVALLSDGGLGAALIRRADAPTIRELESLMALQLVSTLALTLIFSVVAVLLGQVAEIVAVMTASMPFVALQFPGRILLERDLSYRPLAIVEITQIVTYYIWAIALALAGYGVWGLASGTIVMRIASAILMTRVSPIGLVRPRFAWRDVRSLLGFGARFQAISATWLIRDVGLNAGIAAIANASTLGLWTLAKRLLEVPNLVLETLFRVSFPTMSQLVAAKHDMRPFIERAMAMAMVANGLMLTGLAASAPGLVPGLFGDQWQAASYAVPGACLGLAISGSIAVATQSYLFAVGDATVPMRAHALQAVVWVAVTLPLITTLGVGAVGLGWAVSAIFEAVVLAQGMRSWIAVDLRTPLVVPLGLGILAAGVGWPISAYGGGNLLSGIIGGATASGLFLVGLIAFRRATLLDTYLLTRKSIRIAALRRSAYDHSGGNNGLSDVADDSSSQDARPEQ